MIYLDDTNLYMLECISTRSHSKDFNGLFATPLFTSGDTGVSHRKVNELGNTGVINDDRKNKMAWRKFSVTDVALINLADELVSFGFNKNSHLKYILDFLVENGIEIADSDDSKKWNKFTAFTICGILAMADIPTYLVITKDNIIGVFDFAEYKLWVDSDDNKLKNYLVIRLDELIRPILRELDDKLTSPKPDARRINELPVTKLQLKALRLIHSGNFSKIELRLGDGDIGVIKAFDYTTIKKGEKSAAEIGNIVMKMSKHHTVTVYANDGNTITLQKTRTFKD
jgi:hypothetical protein